MINVSQLTLAIKHSGLTCKTDIGCRIISFTSYIYIYIYFQYRYAKCRTHPRFAASNLQKASRRFEIKHYAGKSDFQADVCVLIN